MKGNQRLYGFITCSLFFLMLSGATGWGQSNPAPLINLPLVPDAIAPGSSGFTLTVNGTGFASGSTVYWNGTALPTTFVSASQLTATVSSSDVATAGTASVTVVRSGGGASTPAFFQIASSLAGLDLVASNTSITDMPTSMAAGDFNGDGRVDLVVTNRDGTHGSNSSGTVFLANSDGTFEPGVDYSVGKTASSLPLQIITQDFNHDGKLDLAVTDSADNGVAILLGNGDGTFQSLTEYAAGLAPGGLVAGDLDGDGNVDLAAMDQSTNVVSILLGNGDGTFRRTAQYGTTGGGSYYITTGDFNRDGKLDVAVAGKTAVAVLLGNGDGTLQKGVKYKSPYVSGAMAVADFNGDGKLDVALAGQYLGGPPALAVLLGNGDGTFQAYKQYAANGTGADGMAVGDFNADGKLDVAMSINSGSAGVFLGVGDGTFQKCRTFLASAGPFGIAAGDFNGDGFLDVALADAATSGSLSVLLGTVAPVATLSPTSINFGDVTLGQVSPTQHETITNTGSASLSITSVTVTGSEFMDTNSCPTTLKAAAACSVGVAFKANTGGSASGTLSIADNAADSPQTVALNAVATPMGLSPATVNFGSVKVGTSSPPQTITVTNVRNTALNILDIELGGTNFRSYSETNNCPVGSSLQGGASCSITVTFTPQLTGSLAAQVNISYGAPGSPSAVTLSGTGTAN